MWDSRYRYVGELTRMGAQIRVEGRTAIVEGVERLTPANIQAYDLRAGAAMLIAALAADGVSEITNVQYIERGYEDIIGKLRALGAKIDCVEGERRAAHPPDRLNYKRKAPTFVGAFCRRSSQPTR